MTRLGLVALLALSLAAVPGGAATLRNGLYGQVRVGPIMPVCRVGQPCDKPTQVTLVFSRATHRYRVRTGTDGRYRIALPAAIYTVRTVERIGIYPNIRPRRVKVRAGYFDRIDFGIDTGIR